MNLQDATKINSTFTELLLLTLPGSKGFSSVPGAEEPGVIESQMVDEAYDIFMEAEDRAEAIRQSGLKEYAAIDWEARKQQFYHYSYAPWDDASWD